ncbi:hypothetical protein MMC18_002434 [Xylographa bjoerkii]|nr:hypothetical protein [Xylographa bjoerkii]
MPPEWIEEARFFNAPRDGEEYKLPMMPRIEEQRMLHVEASKQQQAAQSNAAPYLSALTSTPNATREFSCSSPGRTTCTKEEVALDTAFEAQVMDILETEFEHLDASMMNTTQEEEEEGEEEAADALAEFETAATARDASEYWAMVDSGFEARLRAGLEADFRADYGASTSLETGAATNAAMFPPNAAVATSTGARQADARGFTVTVTAGSPDQPTILKIEGVIHLRID